MILKFCPRRKRDGIADYVTAGHSANGKLRVAAPERLWGDSMALEPVAAAGPFTSKNNACIIGWSENLERLTDTKARAVALEVLDQLIGRQPSEKYLSASPLHLHPDVAHLLISRSVPVSGRSPRQDRKGRGHRNWSRGGPGEDACS